MCCPQSLIFLCLIFEIGGGELVEKTGILKVEQAEFNLQQMALYVLSVFSRD